MPMAIRINAHVLPTTTSDATVLNFSEEQLILSGQKMEGD